MNKQDFLIELRKGLSGLPKADVEERISFFSEMIDDKVEEGLSEEQAVLEAGSINEIVSQVLADTPLSKIAKERIKPKRQLKVLEIVLLALGSPIWLSFLVSAFSVVISLYAVLWSLIVSVWAVFVSMVACVLGCVAAGVIFIVGGNLLSGIAIIGASVTCAGLSIFMFYGCKSATRGVLWLTKRLALCIKRCFVKKEVA